MITERDHNDAKLWPRYATHCLCVLVLLICSSDRSHPTFLTDTSQSTTGNERQSQRTPAPPPRPIQTHCDCLARQPAADCPPRLSVYPTSASTHAAAAHFAAISAACHLVYVKSVSSSSLPLTV